MIISATFLVVLAIIGVGFGVIYNLSCIENRLDKLNKILEEVDG
jgi:hypothetical protein